MNSWSSRRKKIILSLILLVLILLVGLPSFFLFYETPSCTDDKRNGDETGVDCGGSCELICSVESLPLVSKGDPRVLTVAPSVYEVVVIIENPNINGEVKKARYAFKLYDNKSIAPLKIIEGVTYIPKAGTFAIFEGPFTLSQGEPKRTTFEWKEESLVWQKNISPVPQIETRNILLSKANSSPRIDAEVVNNSLAQVVNIELAVLVSDESGNIFAASKTYIDSLSKGESAPIVFIWPRPFTATSTIIDIIPRIFPDRSFIR